ncbi:hypothetical protein NDU88_000923 [Pleurodeles waltl]|uniref:Uncharacterized protein n=1 Tax=Pleurodeles waltl TaxID=8319 RepID=A0AAV7LX87_PLEWA|nr:hypothetical protein NDU88_000923 [Pleurodeles waltl]
MAGEVLGPETKHGDEMGKARTTRAFREPQQLGQAKGTKQSHHEDSPQCQEGMNSCQSDKEEKSWDVHTALILVAIKYTKTLLDHTRE